MEDDYLYYPLETDYSVGPYKRNSIDRIAEENALAQDQWKQLKICTRPKVIF